MNLDYVRHFLVVARLSSFTKASKELYIGQSTLSRHISLLEEELGVLLFIRDGRSLELTDPGKVLFEEGARLVEHSDNLKRRVLKAGSAEGNAILEILTPTTVFPALYDCNRVFKDLYPSVRVVLNRIFHESIVEMLNSGCADFAISPYFELDVCEKYPEFAYEFAWHDNFFILCGKKHPLARQEKKQISVKEIDSSDLVVHSRKQANILLRMWEGLSSVPPFTIKDDAPRTREELLLQIDLGKKITVVPGTQTADLKERFCLIEITDSPLPCDLYVVYSKSNKNPYLHRFINIIRNSHIGTQCTGKDDGPHHGAPPPPPPPPPHMFIPWDERRKMY